MSRVTNLQNLPAGMPAEDDRLLAAFGQPLTSGLHAPTGILIAPAGYMGEVTLLSNTSIQVNPFRALIAGTQTVTQGDYRVVNDAILTRAIGPSDPTLGRIDLLVTYVRDTAYVPNEGVDDVRYGYVLPGTPAAAPVAPALPPNALLHGTITVPAGSGAVTFTPAANVANQGRRPTYWGLIPPSQYPTLASGASYGDTVYSTELGCMFVFNSASTWYQMSPAVCSNWANIEARRAAFEAAGGMLHNGFLAWDSTLDRYYGWQGGTGAGNWRLLGGKPGGNVTTGLVAAANWTVGSYTLRNLGNGSAQIYAEVTRTTSALTAAVSSNIANIALFTLPAGWECANTMAFGSGATGRMLAAFLGTGSGIMTIGGMGGTTDLAIGEAISVNGVYPLADPTAVANF